MTEQTFKVLLLVGGSAKDRTDFRRDAIAPTFLSISFAAREDGAAKEKFVRCLREKASCVLDGELVLPADRAVLIGRAREAGAWVVAFDLSRLDLPADSSKLLQAERHRMRRQMHAQNSRVTLDEGFDEVNRVKRIDGRLRFSLFEKRVPMSEVSVDENGKRVEVELGSEYYMIERPSSHGCLMSRAALERLCQEKTEHTIISEEL